MANFWAKSRARLLTKLMFLAVCVLFAFCDGLAQAQDIHFGFWHYGAPAFGGSRFDGPRYDGPRYEGPRYDGPRYYDEELDPPPRASNGTGPSPDMRPLGPRICYTPTETRERVVTQKLHEPFALMREASAYARAEALAGKLCHWNDLDIYEITLLRPDGRVIHVFMNAASGQLVGARNVR